MSERRPEAKKTIESEDYRRFATDTFGIRLNNNFAQLNFSLDTQTVQEEDCLVLEATAVMTLQSLKILQKLLTNTLNVVEEQFGPIQLAPGKEEELEKRWAEHLAAHKGIAHPKQK